VGTKDYRAFARRSRETCAASLRTDRTSVKIRVWDFGGLPSLDRSDHGGHLLDVRETSVFENFVPSLSTNLRAMPIMGV
jgi:hypothetical protein